MNSKLRNIILVIIVLLVIVGLVAPLILSVVARETQGFEYPVTRKVDHVDDYHGTKVYDPYRWLEDDRAAETEKWVEAQNKVTFAYLEKIPFRQGMKARLEKLYNYPKYGAPFRKGEYFYFSKNTGLQNQSVIYRQKGLEGAPEVFLDPNTFSADGTVVMRNFTLSKDGRHAGYGMSRGGSDWLEYVVMETVTKKLLPDSLKWVKVSGMAWQGAGFYYSRYPEPAKGKELSTKNENHRVFYHRVGTPQSEDRLVFEDPAAPQRFHTVSTTEDERFAVLSVSDRGTGKDGNALFVLDSKSTDQKFVPLVPEITNHRFGVIENVDDKFLVETNHKAPNSRVVMIDPKNPNEAAWKDVLPEKAEPLQNASSAGGKLFATYLKDVVTYAYVYSLDGRLENEIKLPGIGTAGGFGGNSDDKFVFYSFTTLNYPPTIFRYDILSRNTSVFRSPEIPGFKASDYETKQIFYTSKDGSKIPMFLVHKKGLKLDGTNPTLLYGYGGFNVIQSPGFNSLRLALLEQGFVYATANLRGGGEYGEKWHQAGMKLKKQNVFDDFIAAAEWLIANKYTSASKLAVQGGSNGGLLVGAVINQRPELFRAAIPQVGVMDMLRFHKFTIGWNWIADYGSSDKEDEFKALYAYSPIHNIRRGVKYPAVLITTADHDDRVVPAHSFKYAAEMQEKVSRENPVLIRIETKSGHGASNTSKAIEQTADIYAFLLYNLGVEL